MDKNFIPLLFAGDINVYSVARAFHESFGIKSYVYGKFPSGPCYGSDIIHYEANSRADERETFLKLVEDFAKAHQDSRIILIGCGDSYVELASDCKNVLPENVTVPYIDIDLMRDLIHKEKFYNLCERSGVDYPDTFVHRIEMGYDFRLPFKGPFIVKPSNGIAYWKHPFPSQEKVFKAETFETMVEILKNIYEAGYDDSIIIQNFIPGDDTFMRVLTCYSDRKGRVKMMCLGHVLLEEHTPHGVGNHAVILTESCAEITDKFRKLLEEMNFVGFSNFDIKYDERDGKYKVFEINTRQGRSNFYVTASGANVAELLVKDYLEEEELEFQSADRENLWLVVPHKVAFDYIKPEKYRKEMKRLIKEGKVVNPLLYKEDKNLARRIRIFKNIQGHRIKFKKYLGK